MKTTKPMLEYLSTCSKISLESFELARLNDRANLRKHMIELLDELIEVDIQARVAEWILAQRRRRSETRPQRRIRRNSSGAAKTDSLALFSTENPKNAFADAQEDENTSVFPELEADSLIPAPRGVAPDSPSVSRRSPAPVAEKAKRIA